MPRVKKYISFTCYLSCRDYSRNDWYIKVPTPLVVAMGNRNREFEVVIRPLGSIMSSSGQPVRAPVRW